MTLSSPRIVTFLWFDGQAEAAAEFYTSIFKNSKITDVLRYGEAGPGEPGSVLTVNFEIEAQEFVGLNGGPHYQFTPAVSFMVRCDSQEEVDYYWEKLLEGGGQPVQCGWLTDKFGVSWQVAPNALLEMISDSDPEKANRAMQAMMQMVKIDIAGIKAAYESSEKS